MRTAARKQAGSFLQQSLLHSLHPVVSSSVLFRAQFLFCSLFCLLPSEQQGLVFTAPAGSIQRALPPLPAPGTFSAALGAHTAPVSPVMFVVPEPRSLLRRGNIPRQVL